MSPPRNILWWSFCTKKYIDLISQHQQLISNMKYELVGQIAFGDHVLLEVSCTAFNTHMVTLCIIDVTNAQPHAIA